MGTPAIVARPAAGRVLARPSTSLAPALDVVGDDQERTPGAEAHPG